MICGLDIAKGLLALIWGKPVYNPDQQTDIRLPLTMRQLVEGDFDQSDPGDWGLGGGEDVLRQIRKLDGRTAAGPPLRPADLQRKIPAPLRADDYRHFYPLLSSFYAWLKKQGPSSYLKENLDHPLAQNQTWPLCRKLEQVVKARTGYELEELFPQLNPETDCGEPQMFDSAFMPLYQGGMGEDDEPLLELLSDILAQCHGYGADLTLPEAAWEEVNASEATRAALAWVIDTGREKLLNRLWRRAIAALRKYQGCSIYFQEWDECRVSIRSGAAEDFEDVLTCGRDVYEMIIGTKPLVNACYGHPRQFWFALVRDLNTIAQKNETPIKEWMKHEEKKNKKRRLRVRVRV